MYFKLKGYGILLLYILTITRCLQGQSHDSTGKIIIHTPVEFTESTQIPISSDSISRHDKLTQDIPKTKANVRQMNPSRFGLEKSARRQLHETNTGEVGESFEKAGKYELSQDFEEVNRSRISGRKLMRSQPRIVLFNDKNGKYHAKQHEEKHSEDLPSKSFSNIDCNQGHFQNLHRGKFSITGNDENRSQMAYQSDSATPGVREGKIRVRGEIAKAEENWQRMEPVVECGDETMTLTVRGIRALHLLVDRANASAVPLAQLPSQCGYSVESTWRDLMLVVPYDACHVKQEEDGTYVLPLIWRGTPVKMSCPVSQAKALAPSSLCCSSQRMTVRLQGHGAKEELRVKVRGEWTPLLSLALQCGYSMDRRHGELLISAPFTACGITSKDGKYTLSLQIGEKAITLACPSAPPDPVIQPLRPATMGPTNSVSTTLLSSSTTGPSVRPHLAPRLQAYPFYQYYYLHTMPLSESYQSPLSSSPPSHLPTTGPSGDPTESKPGHTPTTPVPSHPNYYHPHVTQYSSTTAGHPVHSEAPTLRTPEYTLHPYYHNYHHPKIPILEPPQGPSPVAKTGTSINGPQVEPPAPHTPIFPVFPHYYLYHPKVPPYNPPQLPQPVTPASHSHTFPVSSSQTHSRTPTPDVPHPPPYPHYNPQTPSGEVKRSHHPDGDPFINLQTLKPITSPNSSPTLTELPFYQYTLNFPYKPPPNQKHRYGLQTNNPSRPMDESPPVVPSPPASPPDQSGKSHPHGLLKWPPQQQPNSHTATNSTAQSLSTSSTPVHAAPQPLLFPNFPPLFYPHLKSPISNPQQEPTPVTLLPTAPSSTSSPASTPGPPVYPHSYHHPYYYYSIPYDPYRLTRPVNHASSAPSNGAPTPLSQTSAPHTMETSHQPALPYDYAQAKMPIQIITQSLPTRPATNSPQTPTPSPKSPTPEIRPFPFDPYYFYYHPGMSIYDQDQRYEPSTHAEKTSGAQAPLDSDHYRRGSVAHTPVQSPTHAPHPTTNPIHNPSHHHIIYPQPSTIPSPHHPHPGPPGDLSDTVMKDPGFKADTHTPCGLSDHDCDGSLACCSYPVNECTSGRQFVFAVPGSLVDPTVTPPPLPADSHVSCIPQRMTSDLYGVPLDGCGVHRYEDGQAVVHLLEFNALLYTQHEHSTTSEDSPVRLMVECRSSPGSPGRVRYQVMSTTPSPPVPTQGSLAVQLRIATDEHYSSFYLEKHRPISLLQGRPLHLEVGLLSPPDMDTGLVLLVHYCLAYPDTPQANWLLIYDGCPSRGDSQAPPPSPAQPRHTRRLTITTFQSLPTGSPSQPMPQQIYFMCSTEVCSPADGDCIEGCFSGELN